MSKQLLAKELEKQCPTCRTPVRGRVDFCMHCEDFIEPIYARNASRVRRHNGNKKGPIYIIGALIGLSLTGILGFTVYESIKCLEPKESRLALEKARGYLKANHYLSAINLLESSLAEDRRKLVPERQALLDEALYATATQVAARQDFREAVNLLGRISPNFDRIADTHQLLEEYQERANQHVFGGTAIGGGIDVMPKVKHDSRIDKAVKTIVHTNDRPSEKPTQNSTSETTAVAKADAIIKSDSKSKPLPQVTTTDNPVEDALKRYNSILSAYFSKSDEKRDQDEPPSFEEWMKSGQPTF
ncbi:MAG: hypothetical protein J0H83_07455 [Candidatus Melainabacteria bacterium]|nr:hypothetical protein [Candidatus Melainabacteria bacterium]